MIVKFVAIIGLLFALLGLALNVIADLLNGQSFTFDVQSWSLAISIFVIGFGVTVASLCFYLIREGFRSRR